MTHRHAEVKEKATSAVTVVMSVIGKPDRGAPESATPELLVCTVAFC